jgi:hypothetical protein
VHHNRLSGKAYRRKAEWSELRLTHVWGARANPDWGPMTPKEMAKTLPDNSTLEIVRVLKACRRYPRISALLQAGPEVLTAPPYPPPFAPIPPPREEEPRQ